MQSHASRHVVSEFLRDLHPDLSRPFEKAIIRNEIAEAYQRRAVPKLIAVLDLPPLDLIDEDRAHALRVFNGLLTTQEHKTNAIHERAAWPLCRLVERSRDSDVRRLSCEALGSLAQVMPGRESVVEAGGFEALTGALLKAPQAAAGALRQFSVSNDGVAQLSQVLELVVPALVALINQPQEDGISIKACENAAATLAGIASTDAGIMSCLKHHVPKCIVGLATRGTKGDYQFEDGLMDCMEQCASCLEQVCHHPYGKTAVREADGIKVLGDLVSVGFYHPGTIRKALAALMGVSIEKESKFQIIMHAGRNLCNILRNPPGGDEDLRSNARAALQSAAELLDARKAIHGLLGEQERQDLLFQGPPPPAPPDFRYNVVLPYGTAAGKETSAV